MTQQIAIQGEAGSFSHMATLKIFPNSPQIKFCATFEEAFLLATQKSEINLVCPCENTVAGRVPEFHSLLRRYSLQIYAEHFEKISHNLLAVKGTTLDSIKNVHSRKKICNCASSTKKKIDRNNIKSYFPSFR